LVRRAHRMRFGLDPQSAGAAPSKRSTAWPFSNQCNSLAALRGRSSRRCMQCRAAMSGRTARLATCVVSSKLRILPRARTSRIPKPEPPPEPQRNSAFCSPGLHGSRMCQSLRCTRGLPLRLPSASRQASERRHPSSGEVPKWALRGPKAAAQQGVAADGLVGRAARSLWRPQLNAGTLGGQKPSPKTTRIFGSAGFLKGLASL